MPLPTPAVPRSLVHTRRLRFEAYRRTDGHYDVEAHLTDVKPFDCPLSSGVRAAGTPMHDMWIRLTVTRDLDVVDALVLIDAMPYTGFCDAITPDYSRLVGLNLGRGFRHAVQQRFHDTKGCRHINEALAQFPTAAIQALAGERFDNQDDGGKPFQLDRCHALDTHRDAVRVFYPKWYRGPMSEINAAPGAAATDSPGSAAARAPHGHPEETT
jgi:hypothetical protein